MKAFKNFMKKFSNFKLTALIVGIAAAVGAIAALVVLFMQQDFIAWEGDWSDPSNIEQGFFLRPVEGMVFFMCGLIAVILGVAVAYLCFPYVFKKEKKEPNRAITWLGVAQGGLAVVEAIFAFIMINVPDLMYDPSNFDYYHFEANPTKSILAVVFSVVLLLASAVELAMMYPALTVRLKEDK